MSTTADDELFLALAHDEAAGLWPGPDEDGRRDAFVAGARWAVTPTPCKTTHTPPFDFAQCETHDTTFALGGTCVFDGRDLAEVYAGEADEQRARAVRLELALNTIIERVSEAATDDQGRALLADIQGVAFTARRDR